MKKIVITSLSCIMMLIIVIVVYKNIVNMTKNSYVQIDTGDMLTKIENQQTFTVYFYQDNCSACMDVNSVLEEYIQTTNDVIYSVNLNTTDYKNYLADTLNIQSSPTVIRFVNGEEVNRITSVFTYDELVNCIEE